MPPKPTEEIFTIPQPSWFMRRGLPVLALGPLLALMAYFWLHAPKYSDTILIASELAGLLLLTLLVVLVRKQYGATLTIGLQQVTLEEPNWTQDMAYSETRYLREYTPANGPAYLQLEPLAPTGSTLRISARFPDYERIRQLLTTRVPDYQTQVQSQRLAPQPAAAYPPPLTNQAASRWAWGLNLLVVGLMGWRLGGGPYELTTALGLAGALLAAAPLWYYGGALQLSTVNSDPRPSLGFALWGPVMLALLTQFMGFHFVDFQPLWPSAAAAGAGFGLVLLLAIRQPGGTRRAWHVGQAVALAASFGLAVAMLRNCAFGGLGHARYTAQVQRKHTTYSKGTNYNFTTLPWGPPGTPTEFRVSKALYEHREEGDTLTMLLYRGRLGADWGELVRPE